MVINLKGFKRKIQSQSIPIIEILGKAEGVKLGLTQTKLEIDDHDDDKNKTSKPELEYPDSNNKNTTVVQVLFAINESGSLLVEEMQFKPLFDPKNGEKIIFILKESCLVENIEIALTKMTLNKENSVIILKPNRLPKDSTLIILKNK